MIRTPPNHQTDPAAMPGQIKTIGDYVKQVEVSEAQANPFDATAKGLSDLCGCIELLSQEIRRLDARIDKLRDVSVGMTSGVELSGFKKNLVQELRNV